MCSVPDRRHVCVIVLQPPSSSQPLQVMKIEYVNKRPTYAKAVVSVVDDVECRCQPAPRPPAPKKKSSRRQHSHQHRNQTLSHEYGHEHEQVQCKRCFTRYQLLLYILPTLSSMCVLCRHAKTILT